MISREAKTQLIERHRQHSKDSGSSAVQVAILSARIKELTEHLKTRDKDNLSRRGLLQMVGQRKRLLSYLRTHDLSTYQKVLQEQHIRG